MLDLNCCRQRHTRFGPAANRLRIRPFLARWLVAASLVSGCASTSQPVAPLVAVIQAVENQVEARSANAATQLLAVVGTGLPTGTTLSTGDQSAAVIGFGDGHAVHLASLTAVTLLRTVQLGTGATVHLQLERGRLLGSAPGGWLVVETILGQVSLTGAAAELEYGVVGFDPQDDILIVRCLMSTCEVQSRLGARSLGHGEQLAITDGGMSVYQSELSEAEVDFILGDDVAGVLSAATLTAWPAIQFGATATLPPSSTLTATLTPVPSNTLATTRPPATLTRTPPPSVTPTATPTRQPPTRTPTSSSTLRPNNAPPPASATSPA